MKLKIASPSLQFPFSVTPQAPAPSLWQRRNCCDCEPNQKVVCGAVFLNPVRSRKFLRYKSSDRDQSIRSSYSVNLDGGMGEEPFEFRDRIAENSHGCCTASLSRTENGRKGSNFPSQFDFLEPGMLGIVPEPPNWPEREAVLWAAIEQKAKNFELPVSLRMIKKKQQWEVGVRDSANLTHCSVRMAFSSMVAIIMELQSYALQIREAIIVSKARREMTLSFAWMFQQVFSETPVLMVHIMVLLADFSVYSASRNTAIVGFINPKVVPEEVSPRFQDNELSEAETRLWNTIVDESMAMGIGGLNHETKLGFVSPLTVEIESEDFVDYYRTDFLYQMMLSQDPYSALLLCNYAQFLQRITHDYDRAEECFKRAVQVKPPDAEVLSQYANFLWAVRKDLSGAEDLYQQAIAADDMGNPYYASQYANFLWSTGGEETCFPLNASYNNTI